MDLPRNVPEVCSILGMARYSARFIPNFVGMTTPLHNLTHRGVKWRWSQTEQKLKDTVSSDNVLGYYETGQDMKLLAQGWFSCRRNPKDGKPLSVLGVA